MHASRMTAGLVAAVSGRWLVAGAALLAALVLAAGCTAPPQKAARSCYHGNEKVELDIGYCEALKDGRTLHVSGVTGRGEMASAMRSVYERIGRVLAANGFDFADVVKENVYATDLDAFIQNKDVRKEFYKADLPAATWVQVQRLYLPAFVVEVEVTAEKR